MYKTLYTLNVQFSNGRFVTSLASETIRGIAEAVTDTIATDIRPSDIVENDIGERTFFVDIIDMGKSVKTDYLTAGEIQRFLKRGSTVGFFEADQEITKIWLGTINCLTK